MQPSTANYSQDLYSIKLTAMSMVIPATTAYTDPEMLRRLLGVRASLHRLCQQVVYYRNRTSRKLPVPLFLIHTSPRRVLAIENIEMAASRLIKLAMILNV